MDGEAKEGVELATEQIQQAKTTRITKLVLDGFKSFGKRTELLFDSGFNIYRSPLL